MTKVVRVESRRPSREEVEGTEGGSAAEMEELTGSRANICQEPVLTRIKRSGNVLKRNQGRNFEILISLTIF